MSQRIMSDAEMVKLVELYRENSVLWNNDDRLYKDRTARNSAYKKIGDELGLPLTVLNLKLKNLRSTYCREMKKIQSSVRSGDIYKLKLAWFDTANSFLRKYVTTKSDTNLDEESPAGTEDMDSEHVNTQASVSDSSESCVNNELDITYDPSHTKRRRKDDLVVEVALKQMNNIRKDINKQIQNMDEYDAFSKYIAAALRNMPRKYYLAAKVKIQQTISDIEFKIEDSIGSSQHEESDSWWPKQEPLG